MPFFSVILPTYNRAHLIGKSIESVLKQSFDDWELIIIDDGSTDTTKETVEKYNDPRIRYIFQENQERSVARNNGMEHASGNYVCFLDSDDWYDTERLETLKISLDAQQNLEALFFTDISFSLNGNVRSITYNDAYKEQPFQFLLERTLGTPQVILSKAVYASFRFDPRFSIGEDMELWLRIAKNYPLQYLPDVAPIIALEHDERSLNIRSDENIRNQVQQIHFVLGKDHAGSEVTQPIRKRILSKCYFNVAQHYMRSRQKVKALKWTWKALFADLKNQQAKHRLYCLLLLLVGTIPKEYR